MVVIITLCMSHPDVSKNLRNQDEWMWHSDILHTDVKSEEQSSEEIQLKSHRKSAWGLETEPTSSDSLAFALTTKTSFSLLYWKWYVLALFSINVRCRDGLDTLTVKCVIPARVMLDESRLITVSVVFLVLRGFGLNEESNMGISVNC